MMRKTYELHENTYRKLKEKGIRSWGERPSSNLDREPAEIDIDTMRFLSDVKAQQWFPSTGIAVEFGCGTAPILRHFCQLDFLGIGVDISYTALTMAFNQSEGMNVHFHQTDVCQELGIKSHSVDLVIDGHCLHCITDKEDRKRFLENIWTILKPDGLCLIISMCSPIDRIAFKKLIPGQVLVDRVIYTAYDIDYDLIDSCIINGKRNVPTRYIGYWRDILAELNRAGLDPQLHRFNKANCNEPCSSIGIAATPRSKDISH